MFKRTPFRLIVPIFAASIAFAEIAQASESCVDLNQAEIDLQGTKAELLKDYPGTAAAMFGCVVMAEQQPESEKAQSLVVCAGLACLVVGFGTCYDIAVKVLKIDEREKWINQKKLESGC